MSLESAQRFLEAVSYDDALREKFTGVTCPDEFLRLTEQLGYSFTSDELMKIAKEEGENKGVTTRRTTGVWKWLRNVNWI
ncbi:MAG TPA: Nif11-like leader peptide family natural product precursor [Leptolyngbyaceae cyanobacterium M33_DOE_097]|uniref:Nif11-like leader peptide family natural product n=1 Tax=Oscillatoriales cyanobacterium SpSt-418 TaxID=2282169 RepID=A0A7C3KHD2_9CYAN|nr:Nif11-like leader peptide family natural product precursor [Leptolyngbyaceae cyanobacterium M33_DOE_097]